MKSKLTWKKSWRESQDEIKSATICQIADFIAMGFHLHADLFRYGGFN